MKLSPDQWKMASALLEQALEVPPSQRRAWFAQASARVPEMTPELSEVLRRLVEEEAEAGTAHFLHTLSASVEDCAPERAQGEQAGGSVGVYRRVRELGRGGMGAVWLAERADGLLKRPVALKLPHVSGETSALRERFGRERDILAALTHPNIARLYDAGLTAEGQPFLALEYVEGRTLLEECAARKLDLRQRLELFAQVLEAVKYAHAHLVVHRDLKPSNILVTADGQVKLLDFGIAKLVAGGEAATTELTELSGRAMTPEYASPEQILGQPITTATDVYSLGVLLYELLCGERPYRLRRSSRGALEEAIVTAEAPAPSAMAPDRALARQLRGDLDTIALKALKKRPADRYDSAAALAEDLRRYRAHLPVLAQPDTPWYRWTRFLVRNWVPVTAVAGVFVALVVGTGVALWQARSALQAQARADEVKRFIASIFSDTGPAQGKGGMASAAELLMRASGRVPRELAANPRVAAELDRIIGDALADLGEVDKARLHLERALERDRAVLAERDPSLLHLKAGLANIYLVQGRSSTAEPLLTDVAQDLRGLKRDGARDLVDVLSNLANIQSEHGGDTREQNLETAREAVAVADRWLAEDDPQRLVALSTLTGILRLHARFAEALEVAERAAQLARRQLGARRPDDTLATSEMNLAYLLCANDRPGEAVPLARQVLADLSALKSTGSEDVSFAANVLAGSLRLTGRLAEAADNDRRAIKSLAAVRAGPDTDVAVMHERLAQTQLEARRPAEAWAEMQIADQMTTRIGGDIVSWWSRERQLDRAEALIYLARADEASALIDAVSGQLNHDPIQQWARVAQLRALQLRLTGAGAAAIDSATAALRRTQSESPGPRKAAALRVALAQAMLDGGQAQAARALLIEALSLYDTAQVGLSPRLVDALVGLGRADLTLGNTPSALGSLKPAHEFWQQFDADNLWAAEAAYWYGQALTAAGQLDPGRKLIEPARARLARSPFALHRRLIGAEPALRS